METIARSATQTYKSWIAMKNRCLSPTADCYHHYGGRGITVCDRWRDSFDLFWLDMGERPPGTTLDRIDPDGNYEPGNCRWATKSEQRQNVRPKTHCKHGHALTAGNIRLSKRGWKECLTCARKGCREAKKRMRARRGWTRNAPPKDGVRRTT